MKYSMCTKVPEIKSQILFFTVSFDESGGRQIIISVSNGEQSLFQVLIISEVGCLDIHCFQNAEKKIFLLSLIEPGSFRPDFCEG